MCETMQKDSGDADKLPGGGSLESGLGIGAAFTEGTTSDTMEEKEDTETESMEEDEDTLSGSKPELINGLDDLLDDPRILSMFTPERLYQYLIDHEYAVQPLSRGRLAGKLFTDGGGYKVNWGGDRILQYHPETGTHHGSAYYKLSSGKKGTRRFDLDGNEIK